MDKRNENMMDAMNIKINDLNMRVIKEIEELKDLLKNK